MDIINNIKILLKEPKQRNILLGLFGLVVGLVVVLVVLIKLVFGGDDQVVVIEEKQSKEEVVEEKQEEGKNEWEAESLKPITLTFGDVTFQPNEKLHIDLASGMNLEDMKNDQMLFVGDAGNSFVYNFDNKTAVDVINYSPYHFLSQDGTQAFFQRNDSFSSSLIRKNLDTSEEEIMMNYKPTEIILDLITLDNEKGFAVIRETTTSKTSIRSFYSMAVVTEIDDNFRSFELPVPARTTFYTNGEKIGALTNNNRMEWATNKFVEVQKWDNDRFIGAFDTMGKNNAVYYFDQEDQGHLLVNEQEVKFDDLVIKVEFLTERVLSVVTGGGLFFYDVEAKKTHKMNEAFDVYVKDNLIFMEQENFTEPEEILYQMTFTKN